MKDQARKRLAIVTAATAVLLGVAATAPALADDYITGHPNAGPADDWTTGAPAGGAPLTDLAD
ncbi:hypothetical protein [Streptomyces sp. NPDC049881]|uniref:hypothetical protein n=1 Tax=Streptomyces sp. NPDC049881 TaxID=3155778 RepID=UPI0034461056